MGGEITNNLEKEWGTPNAILLVILLENMLCKLPA
jgi:hypothetical protein